MVWTAFLLGGGLAGLAGDGGVGQCWTVCPCHQSRLRLCDHRCVFGAFAPVGIVPAGLLMALSYMGGEAAQISLSLPNAVTGVFQGMLLFFLLGSAVISQYRTVKAEFRITDSCPRDQSSLSPTPQCFGSGELVSERAGVLNLGVEGMMIGCHSRVRGRYCWRWWCARICGVCGGGALMAALFGFLT